MADGEDDTAREVHVALSWNEMESREIPIPAGKTLIIEIGEETPLVSD